MPLQNDSGTIIPKPQIHVGDRVMWIDRDLYDIPGCSRTSTGIVEEVRNGFVLVRTSERWLIEMPVRGLMVVSKAPVTYKSPFEMLADDYALVMNAGDLGGVEPGALGWIGKK